MNPSNPSNPFQEFLNKFQQNSKAANSFIGISLSRSGRMKILRDSNGKFIWHSSSSELYAAFLNLATTNPKAYKNCSFYAIHTAGYINNKLMINAYEMEKISVTPEMLLVFRAQELDFHTNSRIGLFMPLNFNLHKMHAAVHKEPHRLFELAEKAKNLIFHESKPCVSCGTVCHVPDMSEHPSLTNAALQELSDIAEDKRQFCFNCGKSIIANAAKYSLVSCGDMNKVNTVNSLLAEIASVDMNDMNFDFDKVQRVLMQLLQNVGNSAMTIVDGKSVVNQPPTQVKPMQAKDITNPENINPWLN
jgi:hypothetical protein